MLLGLALALDTSIVQAIDVNVLITILEVEELECHDDDPVFDICVSDPDFYARVEINGTQFDNKVNHIDGDDHIFPNWEFSKAVDITRGSIPVKIEIWDHDSFLGFDDDQSDIDPGAGRDLTMTVDLAPCSVSGDVTGACGTSLTSSGTQDDRSRVVFRIDVVEPVSVPGLNVRCIHDPIWPQASDTVTITASSLDGALAPRIADNIEIWVNDTTTPALSGGGISLNHTVGPFAGPSFSYGCRVQDDDLTVWTGWRVVNIGNPAAGRAVPVLFTGPRSSRIDILFIADRDNYSAASDPNFIDDVGDVIVGAYYQSGTTAYTSNFDYFLRNQDKFNFWIALDRGDAEPNCDHDPPDMDRYTFADAGAILHTDFFRDCAPGGERIFSSWIAPASLNIVLHETGHRPFGLADEYCNMRPGSASTTCDGGYFQASPFPNLYEEPEDCSADAPSLGRTAANCQEFDEVIDWWFDRDWSVSEPVGDDLMVDNVTPQAADVRRMNWMFDRCAGASC